MLDASSVQVAQTGISGDDFVVQIQSVVGHTYQLQFTDSLPASWTDTGADKAAPVACWYLPIPLVRRISPDGSTKSASAPRDVGFFSLNASLTLVIAGHRVLPPFGSPVPPTQFTC